MRKTIADEEAILRQTPWPRIHADGHVNVKSIMQMQAWWVREGWLERVATPAQFLDLRFARAAFAC